MMQITEHKKIRFNCRRGMLELDMLLPELFDRQYVQLSAVQQQKFIDLLALPDPVVYGLIMGHEISDDSELMALVRSLQATIKTWRG